METNFELKNVTKTSTSDNLSEYTLNFENNNEEKTKWVCSVCGYVHYGDTPPEKCPLCGVGSEKFVKEES